MHAIPFPGDELDDPLDILGAALSDNLTPALQTQIANLYANYEANKGLSIAISPCADFVGNQGNFLRSAYTLTYTGRPLAKIRTVLLAAARNRCPSCGGTRPVELDHFLPKSLYAEYAIFPLNLVGLCGPCNKRKSANLETGAGTPFLHPYLDPIPTTPFIDAVIASAPDGYSIMFTYRANSVNDPDLATRIESQLAFVDLTTALASEVGELLCEIASEIKFEIADQIDSYLVPPELVAEYLERKARRIAYQFHEGFWKAVLFRALAAEHDFCTGGYQTFLPRPTA